MKSLYSLGKNLQLVPISPPDCHVALDVDIGAIIAWGGKWEKYVGTGPGGEGRIFERFSQGPRDDDRWFEYVSRETKPAY